MAKQTPDDGITLARQSLDTSAVPADMTEKIDQAQRNLDTAERVLALAEGDEASLAQGVDVVREMSRWQAASTGHAWTPGEQPAEPAPPSEAAFALLERFDVEPTAEQRERIQALDDLDPDVARELAATIQAFHRLDVATEQAYEDVDRDKLAELLDRVEVREDRFVVDGDPSTLPELLGPEVDLAPLLSARASLLAAFERLEAALAEQPMDHAHVDEVVAPPALALDLAENDSRHTENVALSIDAGGNDTYRNNAGGSNLAEADCLPPTPESMVNLTGASAFLDAAGDDDYLHEDFAYCGYNGAGVFGVGTLVDTGGDDVYGADGASGAGLNGAGFLAGLGLLLDTQGVDEYSAWFGINGGGYAEGLGLLADLAGDDTYDATWDAVNGGGAARGVGALLDTRGDDLYSAEVGYSVGSEGANGGGFAAGTGLLLDAGGEDTYHAWREGANGGAWQGGVGTIVDDGGNDTYGFTQPSGTAAGTTSGAYGFNGGAGLNAVGLVADAVGDDTYEGSFVGANGGAMTGSIGRLVDLQGDDSYAAERIGVNGGSWYDGSGLLLDGAGQDAYTEDGETVQDETEVPKGTFGAQLDLPHLPE